MSILQLLPNIARQVLSLNLIKFGLVKGTKKVVDHLVVGVMHISRTWGKEVDGVDIGVVLRHIPYDHTTLPHLVIITFKVWRTRTPFLVRHLWTIWNHEDL
jgi:hypothetical protein